jgi:hypothetical protein
VKNEIVPLFFMLVSKLDKILYSKFLQYLLSACEFLENQYPENSNLQRGIM